MGAYQFTGPYPANTVLPDGSVALVQPGEIRDFDTPPGPAWQPAGTDQPPAKPGKPRTDTKPSKEAAS